MIFYIAFIRSSILISILNWMKIEIFINLQKVKSMYLVNEIRKDLNQKQLKK